MIYKITYKDRAIPDYDYLGAIVFVDIDNNAPDKSYEYALKAFRWYLDKPMLRVVKVESFEKLDYLADDAEDFDEHTVVSWLPILP